MSIVSGKLTGFNSPDISKPVKDASEETTDDPQSVISLESSSSKRRSITPAPEVKKATQNRSPGLGFTITKYITPKSSPQASRGTSRNASPARSPKKKTDTNKITPNTPSKGSKVVKKRISAMKSKQQAVHRELESPKSGSSTPKASATDTVQPQLQLVLPTVASTPKPSTTDATDAKINKPVKPKRKFLFCPYCDFKTLWRSSKAKHIKSCAAAKKARAAEATKTKTAQVIKSKAAEAVKSKDNKTKNAVKPVLKKKTRRTYQCKHCPFNTQWPESLRRHRERHTNGKYEIEQANKKRALERKNSVLATNAEKSVVSQKVMKNKKFLAEKKKAALVSKPPSTPPPKAAPVPITPGKVQKKLETRPTSPPRKEVMRKQLKLKVKDTNTKYNNPAHPFKCQYCPNFASAYKRALKQHEKRFHKKEYCAKYMANQSKDRTLKKNRKCPAPLCNYSSFIYHTWYSHCRNCKILRDYKLNVKNIKEQASKPQDLKVENSKPNDTTPKSSSSTSRRSVLKNMEKDSESSPRSTTQGSDTSTQNMENPTPNKINKDITMEKEEKKEESNSLKKCESPQLKNIVSPKKVITSMKIVKKSNIKKSSDKNTTKDDFCMQEKVDSTATKQIVVPVQQLNIPVQPQPQVSLPLSPQPQVSLPLSPQPQVSLPLPILSCTQQVPSLPTVATKIEEPVSMSSIAGEALMPTSSPIRDDDTNSISNMTTNNNIQMQHRLILLQAELEREKLKVEQERTEAEKTKLLVEQQNEKLKKMQEAVLSQHKRSNEAIMQKLQNGDSSAECLELLKNSQETLQILQSIL